MKNCPHQEVLAALACDVSTLSKHPDLRKHLKQCARCQTHLRQYQNLTTILKHGSVSPAGEVVFTAKPVDPDYVARIKADVRERFSKSFQVSSTVKQIVERLAVWVCPAKNEIPADSPLVGYAATMPSKTPSRKETQAHEQFKKHLGMILDTLLSPELSIQDRAKLARQMALRRHRPGKRK
jgi:hypothetical protein